ncbi:MAG: PAS domain-containing protein, partial [Sediminibacterium sp.]|uniref:PAS domain-containing protein n=1 Tax=Sediminibacterium sp. TaxID=1917865 RepID=UPI00271CB6E8
MISGSDFNLTAFDSLESQKKRLCLLSNTAGIGDWSYIFKTDITIWSEYLYDFYELDKNYNCSILLESTHFYQESEKEKMLALIARVTAERTERTEEFMILMNDGRPKWHTTTIYPIHDEQGSLIGLYGILQNITEKRQVAENKKKEHLLYNSILDRLPIELVVLNKEGQYIYANDAAIKSKEHRGIVIGITPSGHSDLENWIPAVESRRNEVMKECTVNKKSVTFEEI